MYETIAEVVADRTRWAKGKLAELVRVARIEGWLPGEPGEARRESSSSTELDARVEASASEQLVPLRLLSIRLQLDARQRDVLWLLAAIELSPAVACLARVFAASDVCELSVQIVQQLIGVPASELADMAELGLIEIVADPSRSLARRPVRIHDRVLALLRGELALDRELNEVADIMAPRAGANGAPALIRAVTSQPAPLILAVGTDGAGRMTMLASSAANAGHGVLRITTARLARERLALERQLRAIVREAYLFDLVPLFEDFDLELGALREVIETRLAAFAGPVMASVNAPLRVTGRPTVAHVVEKPAVDERRRCWEQALGDPRVAQALGSRYALHPGAIVEAARNALALAGDRPPTAEDVHHGIRAYLGDQLGSVASRVETRQTWDDLVLPSEQFEHVIELVARVRHRERVLDTWGFRDKVGRGHGLAALFSGPPGTGKTMVAGLIAKELGLDLYQVDLSKVTSKYIGETEKQLATIFEAAETGHSIILFDEADSLFAKRSDVKSSNDRYANLEVNYLLQRLEAFTGIALLTTNHETAIDPAFRRRLAVHLRFPTPDEAQREQLWRAMIPAAAAVEADVEPRRLAAEFEMTGGYIKNAVLRAAYLAADEGTAIAMSHLWRAARTEYEAMGKVTYQRAS